MRKLGMLIVVLLFLNGCGTEKKTVTTCQAPQQNSTIVLHAVNNQVQAKTETAFFTFEELGLKEDSEKKNEYIVQLLSTFSVGIDGISASVQEENNGLKIEIHTDYSIVDYQQLFHHELITKEADTISLAATQDVLEELGYQCTVSE